MEKNKLPKLGNILKRIRIDNNELLDDMAKKLGISTSHLLMIEHGKHQVPDNFVSSLKAAYNLSTAQCDSLNDTLLENVFSENNMSIISGCFDMAPVITRDMALEIEFLEWLIERKLFAGDVQNMPLPTFIELAEDYLSRRYNEVDHSRLNDLVALFKFDNPMTLFDRIKKHSILKREEYKGLMYLYDRYTNNHIFKCFFLPLSGDKNFHLFIKNYWTDLHELSEDYLDIYFNKDDLNKTGYQTLKQFENLSVPIDVLPCLILWENSINKAQFIELRKLKNEDVFHLIQVIVSSIKSNKDFESIHREAVIMANEKRNDKKTITLGDGSIYFEDYHGDDFHNKIQIHNETNATMSNFSSAAISAIEKIEKSTELTQLQKEAIIDLIKEASTAIKDENESDKKSCKKSFNVFIKGAGEIVKTTLTTILPPMILSFFGLSK